MPQRTPRAPPRTQRSPQERHARSQAVQRVADQALLRGNLVRMERTCGKKNCRAAEHSPPWWPLTAGVCRAAEVPPSSPDSGPSLPLRKCPEPRFYRPFGTNHGSQTLSCCDSRPNSAAVAEPLLACAAVCNRAVVQLQSGELVANTESQSSSRPCPKNRLHWP